MNTRWHSFLFFVPLLMLAGVAVWVVGVERERAETFRAGLVERGYHPSVAELR